MDPSCDVTLIIRSSAYFCSSGTRASASKKGLMALVSKASPNPCGGIYGLEM